MFSGKCANKDSKKINKKVIGLLNWRMKMKLLYLNAGAHNKGYKQKRGISDSDVNIINEHIERERPDIILLTEFAHSNGLKSILEEKNYQVEISNEDNCSIETCLILIAWKKTSLKGMRSKRKPKVLYNRFLSSIFANKLKIVGVHIPAAYPYPGKLSEKDKMKSLEVRVNEEIEPLRKYINEINNEGYTIIVGDFNPYNENNERLRKLIEQGIHLTDSKIKLEERGWKSIFDGPTYENNKQLDFAFASKQLFEDTEFSFEVKESGFSDHKLVIVYF